MDLHLAYPDIFSRADAATLTMLMGPRQELRPRQRIARANVPMCQSIYLEQGFAARYRLDRTGRRQFLSLHVPGDFIDLPSLVLGSIDHDIDSVGTVVLRGIAHGDLGRLMAEHPPLMRNLWRISLMDAAVHRYWIFRIGRLPGRARVANFFCEMLIRQYARGLCSTQRFELPLTQTDLGEACGITPVHANRMLGELRADGICDFADGEVEVHDLPALIRTGHFSWDYLYLPSEIDGALRQQLSAGALRAAAQGMR